MRKWFWRGLLALPLVAAGGALVAHAAGRTTAALKAGGYTCPLTGEQLPCPNCCPLNQKG